MFGRIGRYFEAIGMRLKNRAQAGEDGCKVWLHLTLRAGYPEQGVNPSVS
jgi:hypothetical protein